MRPVRILAEGPQRSSPWLGPAVFALWLCAPGPAQAQGGRPPRPPVPAPAIAPSLHVVVPRLDALERAAPFASRAGTHSSLFRPEAWRSNAFPLLGVDPTDARAWERAGVDRQGALQILHQDGLELHCVAAAAGAGLLKALEPTLLRRGAVERSRAPDGTTTVLARDVLGRVLAAAALRERALCTMTGSGGASLEPHLAVLQHTVRSGPPRSACAAPRSKAGPQLLQASLEIDRASGCLSVGVEGSTLTTSALLARPRLPALSGPGRSPFAALRAPGIAILRARLQPHGTRDVLLQLAALLPTALDLGALGRTLVPIATGNVALLVHSVRSTANLRTPEGRLFALRFALLVEVSDVARAEALLAELDRRRLASRSGTLEVSLRGNVLTFATAPEASATALAALPSASGRQAAALELSVDPRELAVGLAAIALAEVLEAPELGPLLWLSLELGPLLAASEHLTGWAERGPGTATRGVLELALPAAGASDGGSGPSLP